MFCLSSPSITDHVEYRNWTPLSGRLKCFDKLRSNLELIYPVNRGEVKFISGSFNKMVKIFLSTRKLNLNTSNISNLSSGINNLNNTNNLNSNMGSINNQFIKVNLLDEKNFKDLNSDLVLNVEDDLKNKNKIIKDDNELLRKSNSALRAIRNEKVSQSLQVNKISEIEDGVEPAGGFNEEENYRDGGLDENLNFYDNEDFDKNTKTNDNIYPIVKNSINRNNFNINNKNKNILFEIEEERYRSHPMQNDTEQGEEDNNYEHFIENNQNGENNQIGENSQYVENNQNGEKSQIHNISNSNLDQNLENILQEANNKNKIEKFNKYRDDNTSEYENNQLENQNEIKENLYSVNLRVSDSLLIRELLILAVDKFNQLFEDNNINFRLKRNFENFELRPSKKNGMPKLDLPSISGDVCVHSTYITQFALIYKEEDLVMIKKNKGKCERCLIL